MTGARDPRADIGGPAQADVVKYYASGWPIALAEASCGGDEGCLTDLANCPPGTDGTCTAQAGRCTERANGKVTLDTVCTLRIRDAMQDGGGA